MTLISNISSYYLRISSKYEEQYVAFLDVLGFKSLVNSDKKCEKISAYFSTVRTVVADIKGIYQKKEIRPIIISDSIILVIPSKTVDNDKVSTLRQLCFAIGTIQQKLALENIWIRGAVTLGDVYCDLTQNNIVGTAYIRAYEMEKKAIYPRVIIDPNVIKSLGMKSANELIDEINEKGRILYKTYFPFGYKELPIDLPLIVDYLSSIFNEPLHRLEEGNKVLENLQKSIYQDVEMYGKYRWVADYILSILSRNDNDKAWDMIRLLEKL